MEAFRLLLKLRPAALTYSRCYSVYSKSYIEPIYREEEQQKVIDTDEYKVLKILPVKAARCNETSSVFHDIVIAKFVNYIMESNGRKKIARENLERAFEKIKMIQLERFHKAKTPEEKAQIITDPLRLLKMAIKNCRPLLKLNPIRRGGSTYQVPMPISDEESIFRAMRWMALASREKEGPTHYYEQLAQEILDAAYNRGRVVKQKLDLHKTCEANRAYAHFRWT
ncbi:small ribosomal subunit protein uS7m [Planococcus citri]|uniref:small ribosomal subunit protein uS7m n=1 Tax=Planococcus citri TaxID=170843 RepID=UPI0031F81A6C